MYIKSAFKKIHPTCSLAKKVFSTACYKEQNISKYNRKFSCGFWAKRLGVIFIKL